MAARRSWVFLITLVIGSLYNQSPVRSQESILASSLAETVSRFGGEGVANAIVIEDVEASKIIYSKDAEALLNPASNMKVLTTLAALSFWGPKHRFKTQLLAPEPESQGVLPLLVLKGFGDPTFSSSRLEEMIRELKRQGIRRVARLIVDDSYFSGSTFPGRFQGGQKNAYFNATVGALSLDHNILDVLVEPGAKPGADAQIHLSPELPSVSIQGKVTTEGKRTKVIVKSPDDVHDPSIVVKGNIAPRSAPMRYQIAYDFPSQLAGLKCLQSLQTQGIGAPAAFTVGKAPQNAKVLLEDQSPPLLEIIQEINKRSDNFMAEQLTIALGASRLGEPGDTAKGIEAVTKVLKGLGLDLKGVYMENGSGLSKDTRIRTRTLVDTLHWAYQNPKLREPFLSSLAVLGVDGTLRRRMKHSEMAGYFLGKTGTLNGVTSLSGYVFRKSSPHSRPYLLAFIANGSGKQFWKMKELQNKILETLINQ